jgi:periplasmic protein TonB
MSMMFEQSLLESASVAATRRGLATSISALAQLTLLAIAVLLPMIFTQHLPILRPQLVIPLPTPHYTPPEIERTPEPATTTSASNAPAIVVENNFPRVRSLGTDTLVPDPQVTFPHGGTTSPNYDLPLGNAAPNANLRGPGPLIVSHLNEGTIVRRVQPVYPPLAKLARIEGEVQLEAVISRTGRIENLRVLSGHPMLATAATDAVAQWQFRPYILNGTPVEVVTRVTVEFKLNRVE